MKKVLHLTFLRKWFIQFFEGRKKIEYREIKPYWIKRLFQEDGKPLDYSQVIFRNGYSKNAPKMTVEFLGVRKNKDYEILLGKILATENIDGLKSLYRGSNSGPPDYQCDALPD